MKLSKSSQHHGTNIIQELEEKIIKPMVVSNNAHDTLGGAYFKWASAAEGRYQEGDYE